MGNETSQQAQLGESLENNIAVSWKKVETECPFAARDSHCATAINNKLYVFGGIEQKGDSIAESNDLLVFDVETHVWKKVDCKGDIPSSRAMATLSPVGSNLYLFGGLNQDEGWLEGVYRFDTETETWKLLETSGAGPSPRDKLSSAVIGANVYIFGGFGPKTEEEEEAEEELDDEDVEEEDVPDDQEAAQFGWFNDLFIFNTETNTWSNPMHKNLAKPTPRAATSMCSMGKYLLIFGGRDKEGRTNDLHIFDTVERRWETSLNITGRKPEQRSFHAATAVGSRMVVLGGRGVTNQHFGDLHIFDTTTKQWLQPTNQGVDLPARGTHSVTLVGDHIVVFGGSSDFSAQTMQCGKYYSDTYVVKSEDVKMGKAVSNPIENQENMDSNIPAQHSHGKVQNGSSDEVPMQATH